MKINPRQLEKMAKRMGIQATPIPADEVIIKTPEADIVITNPQVSKVNMMGQETYQITGDVSERPKEAFSEDDVSMVMEKTGATREEVEKALTETNGDLATSILKLKKK